MLVVFLLVFYYITVLSVLFQQYNASCANAAVLVTILVLQL